MGLGEVAGFAVYHRVLSDGRWCSRALAHRLLLLLVAAFVPDGPVVVGLDDTIERRWGARITARGIYRDPVRSSKGHFVKASGLRWLSVMLLAPVPWAGCVWGLPFLTVLAPSERCTAGQGKEAQEADGLGPAGLAAGRALAAGTARRRGGRQRLLGHRPAARPRAAPDRGHSPAPRCLSVRPPSAAPPAQAGNELAAERGPLVGYCRGKPIVPILWVLVRYPDKRREPEAFLCADTTATPRDVLDCFDRRWSVETTYEEARFPHHAAAARPVQRRHALRASERRVPRALARARGLVPETSPDLRRCARASSPAPLVRAARRLDRRHRHDETLAVSRPGYPGDGLLRPMTAEGG